ncbi:MAG: NAD(P)-dependent dehydrogenase (short-subunit alcohol dehydrogenase family) [Saprospiraceae bacterium]|jgi:NAD(P)-dependent dehydrogenase (short-subunit alcohol dehydrogenase family)|tara:strand:- start:875 stop:1636 length:762 start_codon:yes stop_codon:yes gene_type:complete
MNRLENKTAIITGGSGGIGFATAKLFNQEGANIMLVDIDEQALIKAKEELGAPNVCYCVADVSKVADTENYCKDTLEAFGQIDILFSNAGIEGVYEPISEYPDDEFEKVMNTNVKGVWLDCKLIIPKMRDNGSVIITSSVAGLKGFPGLGAYTTSKHAVIGIMRVAALENASRNIRVNTIHPGPINNRMMRSIEKQISPEDAEIAEAGFIASVPLKRYGESSEVAQMALFLASDESNYITGCQHLVDGGLMIG